MSKNLPKHTPSPRYSVLKLFAATVRSVTVPAQWFASRRPKMHEGVVFERMSVPSREDGREIRVDVYRPPGYDIQKRRPVVLNLHGSGFMIPSLYADSEFCSLLAAHTGSLVFDADYRKAPEHPFPAAIQDTEDVYTYLVQKPMQHDVANIFLSGFSAGGNIALAVAALLGPERIKGVMGFYPSVDLTKEHEAPEKDKMTGINIPKDVRSVFYDSYILPDQPRDDPRISPTFADPKSFPRHVYLACGNADALYEPVVTFVEKLKRAGHEDVEFVTLKKEAHAFDKKTKEGTEPDNQKARMYAGAVDMIVRVLEEQR